uniref:Alpha-carbonic anhydrase domain-containing protein n=1 Tax=Romanomermis culicivorax TaxID=13658 RepID=A0A915JMH4_ROMCU
MCAKGQHQSPVNIEPKSLLFDPTLKDLKVNKARVGGNLLNTGQFLRFGVLSAAGGKSQPVIVEDGPLGFYRYSVSHLFFHVGAAEGQGSEHAVGGQKFPAEIQIIGYNSDLYNNASEATRMPHGIVALAILVEMETSRKTENPELKQLVAAATDVIYKGKQTNIQSISIANLLPQTSHYVTYDGSLTFPGCYETVTWIIMNKPIYVSSKDMQILRDMQRTEQKESPTALLADNFRPLKPINNRVLRTNINFKTKGSACPTMYKDMYYRCE